MDLLGWVSKKMWGSNEETPKLQTEKVDRPDLAKHDSSILDLAFAMDCTGSMGSYIRTAQDNVRNIVEQIVSSEKSDVQLALVEYRDHPPEDRTFVTRTHDFTGSVTKMKGWLDACSAEGGGDTPEAVADALHDVLKLSWRENSTKICVLISDAPPHGLMNCGDHFPNGCPANIDPMTVVRQMAEKGITLYSVGCEPAINPYKEFFTAMAYITGGQYVPLSAAKLLTQVIIGGAQEEMSLEKFMADVDEEVQKDIAEGREIDDEEMTRRVHSKLRTKGAVMKQLRLNKAELSSASSMSKQLAEHTSLAALKADFKAAAPPPAPMMSGGMMTKMKARKVRTHDRTPMASEAVSMETEDVPMAMKNDEYETVETEATEMQVQRMVQKSKMRNFKK